MNQPTTPPPGPWSAREGETTPYVLSSLTGSRVLVLAPHPDDEAIGCGGAIRLHTLAGDAVKVVVLTDGRHGRTAEVDEQGLMLQRQEESRASAAVLGVKDLEFWAIPDRSLGQSSEAGVRLASLLESYGPDLVYAPSPLEHHPDHRAAAALLWQAAGGLSRQARVAFYEITQPMAANTLLDISGVVSDKKRAVEQHQSQLALIPYGDLILGLNRYRCYTVSLQAVAVEGYFVTPAVHLQDHAMGAFYTWMINPMWWKDIHDEPRSSFVLRILTRLRLLRKAKPAGN